MVRVKKTATTKSRAPVKRKSKTLKELQELAKKHDIKYSGLKKDSLKAKLNSEGVSVAVKKTTVKKTPST